MSESGVFIKAVVKEAEIRKNYLLGEEVSTIYIGGGTPSVLSVRDNARILDSVRSLFKISDECEITMEVNPDDISVAILRGLIKTGINRISMGIQSWRDADLKLLGRRHDAARAAVALEKVLKAGFTNVTVDMIYGIPGMTVKEWSSNLDFTFTFDISHLSAYHLTIEQGTLLGRMKEKGLLKEIDEEESTAQFNLLLEKAENAGFIQYEISNFGKPGFFSLHNTNYWKQISYLGLGPSAHSFNGFSRQWNPRDLKEYTEGIISGNLSFEREELDIKTRFNEYIMTSLRTMWGIELDYVERAFEKEGYDYLVNLAGKFIDYGLMSQDKKNLVLTNQGKMISDNIISELMLPGDE